jgi:pimeloyl-ACP methyl ester carboxylesterase
MAPFTSELVQTRVGKVEVLRGGPASASGPTIVYLHSATGEGLGLPFTEALADTHAVVAPMFPGFGESEGIDEIDDMEDVAFHLLDLLDILELRRPALTGLSLGGWMAAELATRYPERLSHLVLVNPVGLHIDGEPIKDIFGRSPAEMAKDLFHDDDHPLAALMRSVSYRSDPAVLENLTFDMIKPVVKNLGAAARIGWDPYLHNPKLRRRLYRITVPTLVVRGEHDTLVPAAHAEAYAAEIPGARLEIAPDVAHLATVERGADVARLVSAFIDG